MHPVFFSVQLCTPRLSVCPEEHNSNLAFMSVYILTSSILKAEKHERENSAHTISALCGVLHYDNIPSPLRISYIPHVQKGNKPLYNTLAQYATAINWALLELLHYFQLIILL
jgi:hypothetical protein